MKTLVLLASVLLASAASAERVREVMTSQATSAGGKKEGTLQTEITREGGKARFVEERTSPKGPKMSFDVTFDEATLVPAAWKRIVGEGAAAKRTEVKVADGRIEARLYAGDALVKTSTMDVPAGPYCVPPMVRFMLAKFVASNAIPRSFKSVGVAEDGSLKVAEAKLEDLGRETVKTAAGEFTCRRLKITAKSMWLSAVVPPMELFIAETGTHPQVRMAVAKSTMNEAVTTDLESYRLEPTGAGK